MGFLAARAIDGLGEINPGDDLAALILAAGVSPTSKPTSLTLKGSAAPLTVKGPPCTCVPGVTGSVSASSPELRAWRFAPVTVMLTLPSLTAGVAGLSAVKLVSVPRTTKPTLVAGFLQRWDLCCPFFGPLVWPGL